MERLCIKSVIPRVLLRFPNLRNTGRSPLLKLLNLLPNLQELALQRANAVLRGGGLDESPDCYKRLPEVLAAHGETVRTLHTLTPLGVAMAGANEFDPYKD